MRSRGHSECLEWPFLLNIMHFVYILYSKSFNKYYIGETEDVERRLFYHNNGEKDTFTKRFRPWELKKYWQFDNKSIARQVEIFIKKKKSRLFIERLINNEVDLIKLIYANKSGC